MATITPEEITKLKQELRKDLEALERVERLISGRNGAHAEHVPVIQPTRPLSELPPPEQGKARGVKQLCIEGLKIAGTIGAAPKDLLKYCKEQGYPFTSDTNGSASITTALSRMVDAGNVRREDGRYYWRGGD